MNIRSVTCFVNIDDGQMQAGTVQAAGELARELGVALDTAGFPVQSMRLATQPLSHLPLDPVPLAQDLWLQCAGAGFDYLSLGPVLANTPGADLSRLDLIPELIRSVGTVFAGVLVTGRGGGLHLEAVRRTAASICEIAHSTELGFGNLRLAMLANVGPHAPFFPSAYHDGGPPAVAVATESADLAVAAFSDAGSLDEARLRLVAAIETAAGRIADLIQPIAERWGYRFMGLDFSLAPFPDVARSIGSAVESLGVDQFGAPGTLFAASLLTDCIRKASFPKCGFCGLMLPVLEDPILAARSCEELFTVNDLLLYSSVCGTGLDTVPLPGDVSEEVVAGILLDVATLALRLDKPLTARLMPIPGAQAGNLTEFDFSYFVNGCVLDVKGHGSSGLFGRGRWLAL